MTRAKKTSSKAPSASAGASDNKIRAYVLIQTVPGRVEAIAKSLRRMSSVDTVDAVTGPFDIVALVSVDEIRQLSQTVAGTIAGMRGVTRTTTLLCA